MGALEKIAERASALALRMDGWANAFTGLGGMRDKLTHLNVGLKGKTFNDHQLMQLYVDDDMAARIIDVIPDEMFRQGYRLNIDDDEGESEDLAQSVVDAATKLGIDAKLITGMKWGRLYGAGALFIGADDGEDPEFPLNEDRIHSVDFINVIEKPDLTILTWYTDPYEKKFGQPRTYLVTHSGPGGVGVSEKHNTFSAVTTIHESRLVVFGGALTPTMKQSQNNGFDWSVLERVASTLQEFHTTWKSTAHLMTDMAQGVVSIDGLMDMIRGGQKDVLFDRIEVMNMARSVSRLMLLDADKETFNRHATPIAGVADVLDKAMLRIAGATNIPVSVLFGQDPAGLNASGDLQIRRFYDFISSGQTNELKPRHERVYRLIMLAKDGPTAGNVPESWGIEYNDLNRLNDAERATLRLNTTQADSLEIANGTLLVDEVALSRHTPQGYNPGPVQIDRELRQATLENEKAALASGPSPEAIPSTSTRPAPEPPSGGPEPEPMPEPTDPEPEPVDEPTESPDAVSPTEALNGAQVKSLNEIIDKVINKSMPRETAAALIELSFPVDLKKARQIVATIPLDFAPPSAESQKGPKNGDDPTTQPE